MAPEDTSLMLWALTHGWSAKPALGHAPGCLWRDPAGRRFVVPGADAAPDLPTLSDEVRARIAESRALPPPSTARPALLARR